MLVCVVTLALVSFCASPHALLARVAGARHRLVSLFASCAHASEFCVKLRLSMFLFLACLRARVAAAQCHDAEPHLQKREWVDGDRHCSYRESVVFESMSREFDRLVGPEPKATALILSLIHI